MARPPTGPLDGVTPSSPVVSVGGVVIAGQPVRGEWWADVSMLVLPVSGSVSGDLPLCWDWLFTGGAEVPTEAVRHQALRQMTEAQARVVAVSPPIPIETTTSSNSLNA